MTLHSQQFVINEILFRSKTFSYFVQCPMEIYKRPIGGDQEDNKQVEKSKIKQEKSRSKFKKHFESPKLVLKRFNVYEGTFFCFCFCWFRPASGVTSAAGTEFQILH